MRKSSLAYKYEEGHYFEPNDAIETQEEEKKQISWKVFSIYIAVFIFSCMVNMSNILQKTEYNMEIEELKKTREDLTSDIGLLKSEIDVNIDLKTIEDAAKKRLKMYITDEIKYIKL